MRAPLSNHFKCSIGPYSIYIIHNLRSLQLSSRKKIFETFSYLKMVFSVDFQFFSGFFLHLCSIFAPFPNIFGICQAVCCWFCWLGGIKCGARWWCMWFYVAMLVSFLLKSENECSNAFDIIMFSLLSRSNIFIIISMVARLVLGIVRRCPFRLLIVSVRCLFKKIMIFLRFC